MRMHMCTAELLRINAFACIHIYVHIYIYACMYIYAYMRARVDTLAHALQQGVAI